MASFFPPASTSKSRMQVGKANGDDTKILCNGEPTAISSGSKNTNVNATISIPHLSFATDLLFNLDENRIALERTYASELTKIAQQSQLEELETGTMKEALGKLKAQYLNTSVQHRLLATNLEEDVLKPIEQLYIVNNQKAQNLAKLINNIKKQTKVQEDAFKKDYAVFDKHFRDATMIFAAAMDAGFSSTAIEQQYHRILAHIDMQHEPTDMYGNHRHPVVERSRQKSAVAIQTLNNNSQKLVNWLLASEQQRKENVCNNAVKAIESAEMSRRKCQLSWQNVEQSRIDMYRSLQSILTEYQKMAENRISNLAANLRKHVVFESSALANEQYDWQMIASKIENVDFEGDMCAFILNNRSHDLLELTVNDLCSPSMGGSLVTSPTAKPFRPLKKVPLEIRDLASRKIPLDYDGNQELLSEVLVTRQSPIKVHPVKCDHPLSGISISVCTREQLGVDCNGGPTSVADEKTELKAEDIPGISLAQDVARAIARAYEIRVMQTQSVYESDLQPNDLEPEYTSNKTPSNSISRTSSNSISFQTNDLDQEDRYASQYPTKEAAQDSV